MNNLSEASDLIKDLDIAEGAKQYASATDQYVRAAGPALIGFGSR